MCWCVNRYYPRLFSITKLRKLMALWYSSFTLQQEFKAR